MPASLCRRFTLGDRAWEIDLMTLSINDAIVLQELAGRTWLQIITGLDEGDADGAVALLLQLVESGVIPEQPSLSTAYFNLGLAFGMTGQFGECLSWFQRMVRELPHKRSWMARELERRSQFVHLIRSHPDARVVTEAFPSWFVARPAG